MKGQKVCITPQKFHTKKLSTTILECSSWSNESTKLKQTKLESHDKN